MVTRVKLTLEQAEYTALPRAAITDLRNPLEEVRYILRSELIRRGYLDPDEFHFEEEATDEYEKKYDSCE